MFAIDVDRSRALEWSAALDTWCQLDPGGHIDDPALEVALPIAAMIHAAKADDAVARALLAKRNPVLEAARAQDRAEGKLEGRAEGKLEGRAEALILILTARAVVLDRAAHARILQERDPQRLDRWIERAVVATTASEVFAGD